ncbi:MOSC domain-containing protein [Micromonospora sp. WMMC415]|uniref:MOSC domain-containing protein n=1 Tax=Micromonospora sp. WMMC415 TaxID=2675222 RepID=UPI0012B47A0E|nr:MOSC domain-containing protein [Micromonospora sp. WMMC415]QGN47563.1 MOSC domain-containing protein [Micromonospora sp. WMMC415]
MELAEIRRYPIKSLLGEQLAAVDVDQRGLVGDRSWAVRDADGKLGSGKNTRRFRRMPGLFTLRGHFGDPVPLVELPDGRRFAADAAAGHEAVSKVLARRVTIERQAEVMHHDEGPVSLISTAALRRLHDLLGEPVEPLRFRANLLVDVPGSDFPEDGWLGRTVRIGSEVVLRPRQRLTRCVMIDLAQEDAPEHGHLLRTVADHHDMTFGVWATVERPGRIALGDAVEPHPQLCHERVGGVPPRS